jgi:YbbR domain-containing protein
VRSYRLTPANVENSTAGLDVQIEEILDPKEIEIVLDRRAERRVEVIPLVELEIAEAYAQVGGISIEPRKVEISGPSTQIHRVEFIETDSLHLRNVREDIEEKLRLRAPDGMRLDLTPTHVTLEVDVQILAENDIADVPVQVRHARGRSVIPEPAQVKVTVKGGVDIIANLDPEKDLDLYVDYRDFDGQSLLVLAAHDSLFEIREIVPPQVDLVER